MRRTRGERVAAWLRTGPIGHLYAFVADAGELWLRWAGAEVRARVAGAGAGSRRRARSEGAR